MWHMNMMDQNFIISINMTNLILSSDIFWSIYSVNSPALWDWFRPLRVQQRFQKMYCWAGQAAPPSSLLPLAPRNLSYIARTQPKTLFAERGKLESCSVCPIAVFCQIHLQLATGQVVMLHADRWRWWLWRWWKKDCTQIPLW